MGQYTVLLRVRKSSWSAKHVAWFLSSWATDDWLKPSVTSRQHITQNCIQCTNHTGRTYLRLRIHNRCPTARPQGRTVGHLLWVNDPNISWVHCIFMMRYCFNSCHLFCATYEPVNSTMHGTKEHSITIKSAHRTLFELPSVATTTTGIC